ncbi:MAG: CRTAC1 family protein [Pirellulales bacterium]|nr:CRTAC1 family protein [Pirellulales bacterium]
MVCWLGLSPAVAESPILLRDVTRRTGITFRHTDGSSGRRYIVETVSAGLALFDYDQDGDIDIYFLNGAPLPGTEVDETPTNALYRNDGGWKFVDVTREANVGDPKYGLGVAAADYDNDGDQDVYVNNFGPNVLYRNNGDGTFSDTTNKAGVANGHRVGAGVSFLDIDKDGYLDLYVSNYVVFSFELHRPLTVLGIPTYRTPSDYAPDPDTLYRNQGDGTFEDVSASSGIAAHAGTGMGIVSADYDNDGDTDVFVCNDVHANFLFQNDGKGHFDEVAMISGTAFDYSGAAQGSMGVDCGDYNNDGLLDFFQTSYQGQMPALYRNLGAGMFEDVTLQARAGISAFPHVNWGTGFVDFDNDGDRDIFLACGHLMDNIELRDDTTSYLARNILLLNTGNGQFLDVSESSGDGMDVKLSSRGTGFDDLDNDGDIDVVVLNSRREPTILRNDSANDHHWLQVHLQGVHTNRDGVGSRVKVVAGDLTQIDEVHSGRGYQSHHGSRLHFGLGRRDRVDRVEVRWLGGAVEVFDEIGVDRLIKLKEGTGKRRGMEQ